MPVIPTVLAALLHPWLFVGGALCIAVPIIIHLLNRQRFRVVSWAAMEFLLRAMRQNRKRLKMEQWILLATRCAAVVLVALALARPMSGGCAGSSIAAGFGGRAGLNVFVIDNSYSAAYEGPHAPVPGADGRPLGAGKTHLEQQKLMAKRLIDTMGRGGESVVVITAAKPATAVIAKPGYNLEEAKRVIDGIEQAYTGTDLPAALALAREAAKEDSAGGGGNAGRALYLFTDGTRSAWEGAGAETVKQLGPELANLFRVTSFNLTQGRQQWNHAVLDLKTGSNLVTTRFETDLLASVAGYGTSPSPQSPLQWSLGGKPLGKVQMIAPDPSLPPQRQRLQPTDLAVGGAQEVSVSVDEGAQRDPLPIDDRRVRVVEAAPEVRVLIVEGQERKPAIESPGFFLRVAWAPAGDKDLTTGKDRSTTYVSADTIAASKLGSSPLGEYRAVALCDVPQVSAEQARALAQFVYNGGSLLIFMGETVDAQQYNRVLGDPELVRRLDPRVKGGSGLLPGPLVGLVDQRAGGTPFVLDFNPKATAVHPYLEEFKGLANTGLDTSRVNTYMRVDVPENSNVSRILSYRLPPSDAPGQAAATQPAGSGQSDPAITAHPVGQGTVVFVTTAANPISLGRQQEVIGDEGAPPPRPPWHGLAATRAWVQLAHELLRHSVTTGDAWMNLTCGSKLRVPLSVLLPPAGADGIFLTDKDGGRIKLVRTDDPAGTGFGYESQTPIVKPGIYSLPVVKEGGTRVVPIAVNVPPDEADVRTIGNDKIREQLGGTSVGVTMLGDELPIEAIIKAREGSDWAGLLLVALFGLLAVECFMAMKFGHYRTQHGQPAAAPAAG